MRQTDVYAPTQMLIRRTFQTLAVVMAILLVFVGVIWLIPERLPAATGPSPASYEAAVALAEGRVAADDGAPDLNPDCVERAYLHEEPTDKVVVIFHGFTSCPAQWETLATELFEAGHNVLVPRLPRHGSADRTTDDLRRLTAEELIDLTAEMVGIARPLGDELVVAGLSGGGSMAMWAAQRIEAIDRVVLMAPLVGIGAVPDVLTKPVTNIARIVPSFYVWWDGEGKADSPRIVDYSYPGYETRGVGQVLRIGVGIYDEARRAGPASDDIVLITNGNDGAVNGAEIDKLVARWQRTDPGLGLVHYEFPESARLPHDLITVEHPDADIDLVYPVVVEALVGDPASLGS